MTLKDREVVEIFSMAVRLYDMADRIDPARRFRIRSALALDSIAGQLKNLARTVEFEKNS